MIVIFPTKRGPTTIFNNEGYKKGIILCVIFVKSQKFF